MKITLFLFSLTLVILISSCSPYKNVPYYQDLNHEAVTEEKADNYTPLLIQPGDILGINVSGPPESSAVFNYNLARVNGNNMEISTDNPIVGYLVDQNGDIHLPLIGALQVKGITTSELSAKLDQLLLTYYKDVVAVVRLINFKVAIYGDVQRPNVYTLQNERTTITQALSLAGDLNITAMRKNIILVREENGKRIYVPIDLTSKKLFDSPYYYLKNNDEIYVQADRTKFAEVDRGYKTATLVLSGLSIIAIVLSNLYRVN